MAPKNEKKQEAATEQSTVADFGAFAAKVENVVEIFPKLSFGEGKLDEVKHEVVFLEAAPRSIVFEDRFSGNKETPGFAINVMLLGPENEPRSILMRADPNHGLTRGIVGLYKKRGTLLNVRAVVETRNYPHKTFGETRGYTVYEKTASAQPAQPATAEAPP